MASAFSAALALLAVACTGDIGGRDSGATDDSGTSDGSTAVDGSSGSDSGEDSDASISDEVRAFPGAEGFGALATGGRGGRVIKVTTLAATGPGSLQDALDQDEPRIVVFAVSGVIEGDITVTYGDVTIAGQTAPGAGITIHGRLFGEYDTGVGNMIIRHVRVRPEFSGGDGAQFDGIQFSRNSLLIFDHVSVAFGVDETVDIYEAQDVTIQWSSIEMSATSGHPEGVHNYGLINGPAGRRVSVHHTLFAHHQNRCPAIANGPAEVRNNVAYNVRHGFVHHNPASGPFNIVGNYFRDGGDDELYPFYFDDESGGAAEDLAYYLSDNYVDDPASDCDGVVENPWTECSQDLFLDESYRAATEHDFSATSDYYRPVTTQSSTSAYDLVLDGAGAFPRDVVTAQAVQETRDRTGSWGADIPPDLLAGLTPGTPPLDSDGDGMPDAWETAHSLDPDDGTNHDAIMPSGYTAIEEYINGLADQLL